VGSRLPSGHPASKPDREGAFWTVAGTLTGRGSAFLSSVAAGRLLGSVRLGEYAMAQSTAALFGVFGGFGWA